MRKKAKFSHIFLYCTIFLLVLGCASLPSRDGKQSQWTLKRYPIQLGWRADDRKIPFLFAHLPEEIPSHFVLPNLLPPGNQGPQASGTAWALGYFAVSYLQHEKYNKKDYQCAPAFLYNSLNQGRDRGIEVTEGLHFLKAKGCPEEKYMPYQPKDPLHPPTGRARRNAAEYSIKGFGRVDYTDMDQLRGHLLLGKPIIVNMKITKNFIELRKSLWKKPKGKLLGRHTVTLIGFDNEKETFHIQNSVGRKWGEKGKAEIPYAWLVRLTSQAYVIW